MAVKSLKGSFTICLFFKTLTFYLSFPGNSNTYEFVNHSPKILKEFGEFQPEASNGSE